MIKMNLKGWPFATINGTPWVDPCGGIDDGPGGGNPGTEPLEVGGGAGPGTPD